MSSDYTLADDEVQGQHADKDADRQERVKAKNRRAQKRYREKKLQETDQYKLQVSASHMLLLHMHHCPQMSGCLRSWALANEER